MQSEVLAKRIFDTIDYNYSGFMDWGEFLKLMVIIRAKTLAEKINLFIKIADVNKDGSLEWDEIKELAMICLGKYIKDDGDEDGFLSKLCDYFTKLICKTVNKGVEVDKETVEIPLPMIKKTIINGGEEADLLCMFCGADI